MTQQEKQKLCKLIQELPPKNLDRVVEIIQAHHGKSSDTPSDEMFVELEEQVLLCTPFYPSYIAFTVFGFAMDPDKAATHSNAGQCDSLETIFLCESCSKCNEAFSIRLLQLQV